MIIDSKTLKYEWQDNWAGMNGDDAFSHGGIAIDSDDKIYCSFNSAPYLRVFTKEGEKVDSFELSGKSMHCLSISKDSEGEWLWNINLDKQEISKCTLNGKIVKTIGHEAFGVAEGERLQFTALSIDPNNGNVWVTDGYGVWLNEGTGGSKVYCFNSNLELQFSFDGSEAECGKFNEPHWIFADTRKGHTEIFIADRSNHRIVIYSAEGKFLRVIGGDLHTPSGFSSFDDKLVVTELKGRLHIIDINDNIIETLCDGSEYSELKGWPHRKQDDKVVCPLFDIEQGKFNSPHGVLADSEGNIYVHEWLQGIRITKLKKVA